MLPALLNAPNNFLELWYVYVWVGESEERVLKSLASRVGVVIAFAGASHHLFH